MEKKLLGRGGGRGVETVFDFISRLSIVGSVEHYYSMCWAYSALNSFCLNSSLVSAFIFLDHAMSAPIAGGVEGRRLKILAWEAGLALDFC